MKTILMTAAVLAAMSMQPSVAQQTAAADAKTQQAPGAAELDAQYAKLQEQMKQMHDQMEKIAQTKDPQERQQLLQKHWASMQSAMAMMHSSWGGMMGPGCCAADGQPQSGHRMNGQKMGGPMMGGHMMKWGDYRALTPDQLRERQYMMDRWMPMQQMMMDQMMQHQYWMQQPAQPVPPAKKK